MVTFKPFNLWILGSVLYLLCTLLYANTPALLEQLKNENVVDTTQTLSADEIEKLKQQNEQLYKEANVDFKILMIPTTDGESIEQYALDVFNTLKIGNEKLDNGLLLLIAKDDRKMRFEVGYGLEGELTDIKTGRINRNILEPHFRQNQFFDGVQLAQIEIAAQYQVKLTPVSTSTDDKSLETSKVSMDQSLSVSTLESESTSIYRDPNDSTLDLSKRSKNPNSYIAVGIWTVCFSLIIATYLNPILFILKDSHVDFSALHLLLLFFLTIHSIFCWVTTGQNILLILLCSLLALISVMILNHYLRFWCNFKKRVLHRIRINWTLVLFFYIFISLGSAFFSAKENGPLFIFFAFLPFLMRTLWTMLHNVLFPHKLLYPFEQQDLFFDRKVVIMSGSFGGGSNGGSSKGSHGRSSRGGSSGRSSGGRSGGGGASGSW